MTRKNHRWIARLAWLAAGLVATNAPWAIAEDAPSPEVDETRQQSPQPAAAGLLVFIDPETGEVTDQPTAEQRAWLAEAMKTSLNKSAEGLQPFELIHGGHGVHLQGRFQSATIVRRRPDGSFEIGCTDHPDRGAALLTTPPPPAAGEWEEK